MSRALMLATVGSLVLTGCQSQADKTSVVAAAAPPMLSAKGLGARIEKGVEASPAGRLLIGRGQDYTPIAEDPSALFTRLEGSMADRRKAAWAITEAMLQPQKLTVDNVTYEVPLWHTWYEGMQGNPEVDQRIRLFITQLKACKADPTCKKTRAEIASAVLDSKIPKNLVPNLTAANLTQVLTQSQDVDLGNPDAELGRGFTMFSPSFVQHVLTNAEGIEKCSDRTPWNQAPPSATQFSPCVPEFPRSAVMVKTSWDEIEPVNPQVGHHKTDAAALKTLIVAGGTWPAPTPAVGDASKMYTVETTDGRKFGLKSIHFSTKDTREWIWVSLWWSPTPDDDFGQDRPASLAKYNGGVWANYKMCVTTAFTERDPKPWATYETKQPKLAAALKAAHEAVVAQKGPPPYDAPTTWCSNPTLEHHTGNGPTNCIGCHQYSLTWNTVANRRTRFSDTFTPAFATEYPQLGRARRRLNFPAEFAWSFGMEFRGQIANARQSAGFSW